MLPMVATYSVIIKSVRLKEKVEVSNEGREKEGKEKFLGPCTGYPVTRDC